MAVMYPRTLFEPDLKSRAEGKVFDALEARLDDDWEVFHSAGWVVRDQGEGAEDDEIDFVLVPPRAGDRLPRGQGRRDRVPARRAGTGIHDGKRERIRDPFRQALDHTLRPARASSPTCRRRAAASLAVVHAVAFPDITVHQLALAPDAPREIIIDRNDLDDDRRRRSSASSPTTAAHGTSARRPAQEGAKKLRELLAPACGSRCRWRTVPRGGGAARQASPTSRPRCSTASAATGGWSSPVRRLGQDDARGRARASGWPPTARTCSSSASTRGSGEHLRKREKDSGHRRSTRSTGSACAGEAGQGRRCRRTTASRRRSTWTRSCRCALVEAIEQARRPYDAIFVDEARTCTTTGSPRSSSRCATRTRARLALHGRQPARLRASSTCRGSTGRSTSTVNCRNTQAIHREVMKLYQGEVKPEASGPEGREASCSRPTTSPERRQTSSGSASRRRSGPRTSSCSQLARPRELGGRAGRLRQVRVRRQARADRRLHLLLARSAASRDSSHRS